MYVQANVGLLCCVGSGPIVALRPIHTYHAVPMPFLCHAVPLRVCLSHLIHTVRPCLIHTCHAMPLPCFDHAVLLKATAQHVRRETACALPTRVRLLPATMRSSTKVVLRSIPISAHIVCRHHGMARPQVADRGTASDKEGSWE